MFRHLVGLGNPLQYYCLENSMDKTSLGGSVHRVTKSQTRLKRLSTQHRSKLSPLEPPCCAFRGQCGTQQGLERGN